jgi:hypothetical protein
VLQFVCAKQTALGGWGFREVETALVGWQKTFCQSFDTAKKTFLWYWKQELPKLLLAKLSRMRLVESFKMSTMKSSRSPFYRFLQGFDEVLVLPRPQRVLTATLTRISSFKTRFAPSIRHRVWLLYVFQP